MDAAIAHIEKLASTADENTRRKLRLRLLPIAHSIEDTNDTFNCISVKIGLDLGLFKCFTDSKECVTQEIIAVRTSADILLLGMHNLFLPTYYLFAVVGVPFLAQDTWAKLLEDRKFLDAFLTEIRTLLEEHCRILTEFLDRHDIPYYANI
ncbi:hypothetical protein F4679DRAFT_584082 [Xylaria curta]|nr:hypothetical protein F4679DRAFT_584082 [Xylaria curta]